jgi:hypothetical protein
MEQLTAVEWLIKQLNEKIDFIPMHKWDMIRDIVHQAKAMEKEQIIDTFQDSRILSITNNCNSGEQYYNETFKQD